MDGDIKFNFGEKISSNEQKQFRLECFFKLFSSVPKIITKRMGTAVSVDWDIAQKVFASQETVSAKLCSESVIVKK